MLRKVGAIIGLLAVATLLAQGVGLAYLAAKGRLNARSVSQIAAILHGVDLLAEARPPETPTPTVAVSVDEILQARALRWRQLELREQSIEDRANQLRHMQRKLQEDMTLYQQARQQFEKQLNDWQEGEEAQAREEAIALFGRMRPKQAKEQLLEMLKSGETDAVLTILKGLPVDKQSKIFAEFKEPEEVRLLADILRRLREGEPRVGWAEQARARLEDAPGVTP